MAGKSRFHGIWPAAALSMALWSHGVGAHISYDEQTRIFRLSGEQSEYFLGVDDQGYLRPIYWGRPLDPLVRLTVLPPPAMSAMDVPGSVVAQEYAGQGGGILTEPGIKVAFADGNRDLVLKYRSHHVDGDTLTIDLADISRPFTVTLRYVLDSRTGIIGRSASARNDGSTPVRVDQIAAATMTLPYQPHYRLSYLAGRWAAEFSLHHQPIGPALSILESRRGATSDNMSPWFAVDRELGRLPTVVEHWA